MIETERKNRQRNDKERTAMHEQDFRILEGQDITLLN